MVVIPYVKGFTEKAQRIYGKHNISTAMKPHCTIRNILVHPKDQIDLHKRCDVVYKISINVVMWCIKSHAKAAIIVILVKLVDPSEYA